MIHSILVTMIYSPFSKLFTWKEAFFDFFILEHNTLALGSLSIFRPNRFCSPFFMDSRVAVRSTLITIPSTIIIFSPFDFELNIIDIIFAH